MHVCYLLDLVFSTRQVFKYKLDAGYLLSIVCEKFNVPCQGENSFKIQVNGNLSEEFCTDIGPQWYDNKMFTLGPFDSEQRINLVVCIYHFILASCFDP